MHIVMDLIFIFPDARYKPSASSTSLKKYEINIIIENLSTINPIKKMYSDLDFTAVELRSFVNFVSFL